MDSNQKNIHKHIPKPSQNPVGNKFLTPRQKTQFLTIGTGIVIVVLLIFGIMALVKSLDFSAIIFSFGKNLRTDQYGHTNILLAGLGGEGHDGADLTDTIMVASIDYDHHLVSMLSIPRDLYVKSEKLKEGERINQIYSVGKNLYNSATGMQELADIASGITGVQIDYYVKVDFKGFVKIVDSLGGVDVVVEKDIYDPFYPLGETTRYQTFSLKAGPQHLDGETALKYARSRKTTSDFDRALRQQQLMMAIKEKALSLNILTDPGKIQELYNSLSDSIETNLSVNEILGLAKISKDFKKENVLSNVLSDNPAECGGFLYTPAREFFNNSSVLLPAGKNYDAIHTFTKLLFMHPDLLKTQDQIQVLNGTKTPNVAGEVTSFLNRICLNVIYYGNAANRDIQQSTIFYKPGPKGEKPEILDFLSTYLPFNEVPGIPAEDLNSDKKKDTDVVIELGKDYLSNRITNPFDVLPYYEAPITQTQLSTQQDQSTK